MSIINDLELSVRAGNILRRMNPDMTFAEFMALDQKTVMAVRHAGRRTWREIDEMQQHFRSIQRENRHVVIGGPAYPIPGSYTHETWPRMSLRDAAALAALPSLIDRHRADIPWSEIAPRAYEIADAFIAARETKET